MTDIWNNFSRAIQKKPPRFPKEAFFSLEGGLLLELFGQELIKVFTRHVIGFKESADFTLHIALAGPFNAVGKTIFDGGLSAGLFNRGSDKGIISKLQIGALDLEIGDDFERKRWLRLWLPEPAS